MLTPVVGFANDYTFVEYLSKNKTLQAKLPYIKVSIIVTHYKRLPELKMCLQALTAQTLNPKNFEVIVSDDGSCLELSDKESLFEIGKVFDGFFFVEANDDGFRLSRARNLGIRLAKHDYCLILDCDLIPCEDMVRQHLKNVLVSEKVISIGFRYNESKVQGLEDIESFEGRLEDLDWRYERYFKDSLTWSKLTSRGWLFMSGGNFMMSSKHLKRFEFEEGFTFWGGEDNELGYRLAKEGFYFKPEFDARSHHVTALGGEKSAKKEDNSKMRLYLESLCPSLTPITMRNQNSKVPFVSFWITNYNKNKFLEEAVQSCAKSSFSYEIILVDNCSTVEGTETLLESLKSKFKRLKVFREDKKGAFHTFNKALEEARGEILVQIDGDDIIDVSVVDRMIYNLYISPLGLMFSNHAKISESGEPMQEKLWRFPRCSREDNLFVGMHVRNTRVFRKRDLSRAGVRSFTTGAVDYSLYSKILLVSYGSFIDETSYFYRQVEDSISHAMLAIQKKDTLDVIDENLSSLELVENLEVVEVKERSVSCVLKGAVAYLDHLCLDQYLKNEVLDVLQSGNLDLIIAKEVLDIDQKQHFVMLEGEDFFHLKDYNDCLQLLKRAILLSKKIEPALSKEFLIDQGF